MFLLIFPFVSSLQAAPVADFNANILSGCTSQSITFTNTSTGNITTYSWNFGAGASPATASTAGPHNVTYSTAGQKTISLTVNGPDGMATITKTNYITINSSSPVLSGSITGNSNVCINSQGVQYSIPLNSSATSYSWTVPAGSAIASGQGTNSITVNFGATLGNVCVTASNGCGNSNQLCKQVSVGKDRITFMCYNLLNYPDVDQGSITTDTTLRNPFFRTTVAAINPDIMVIGELISLQGYNGFLSNVMNANGNVYSAATYINSFDTDNGLFYKTSKFQFISNTPIQTDLRDINEFKLLHLLSGDTLRVYAVHLKASPSPADEAQRAKEVDSLRKVTNLLPAGSNFIVCGDFNIYNDSESAYQKLIQVNVNNEGHFIDPIPLSGSWNNPAYSLYHTQSPRTRSFGGGITGGLDDRFDLILYSKAISLSGGMTYVANSTVAYGNDGAHFNDSVNHPPNAVVSQAIADALHNGSDHLPVVANFEFENTVCAIVDAGATQLIAPSTPSCTNASQPLQVQIKNYGSNTINFSNTNLQVVLEVTNPSSSLSTFTKTLTSGTLAANAFLTVAFDNTLDMSVAGSYTFEAHTVISGDTTPVNNNMPSNIVNVVPNTTATITPAGPTTFCSGGSVVLNANTGTGITYQWQKNAVNIPGATASNVTASQSGNYTVIMQKTNLITNNFSASAFTNVNTYNIPDNSCTGASSTINVTGFTGNIATSGISVLMNINHQFVGDLAVFLEAPNGERLGLANRVGSLGDNYVNTNFSDAGAGQLPATGAPYTGTYKPWTSTFTACITSTKTTFASLGGGSMNPNGNWRLIVYDRSNSTTGMIVNWQISFPAYTTFTTVVCDPVTSLPVTVASIAPPAITFNPASPAVCSGEAVTITASGANTYEWSPSSGLSATTGNSVIANPSSATTYTVIGTDANGCSNSSTVTVTLSESVSVTLDPFNNVCLNTASFPLTGGQPAGGVYSGTGVSSGFFTPSVAGTGNHLITYTYSNGGSCAGSASSSISVSPLPDATVLPPGPISICQGNSVNLYANSGNTYLWSNSATTQTININSAGNYSVVVTNAQGCSAASPNVNVFLSANAITGVLFTETMGSVTGTTSVSSHESNNGFDNDNLTMSGTGDVRNTTFNGLLSNSEGANIFLTNTIGKNFIISGINSTGLSNIELTFGVQKNLTASNGSDLLLQYSTDGTNYSAISFPLLATGPGTTAWQYVTASGTIPATANLRIQFLQNGSVTQYRIDDLEMTYTISSPLISASGATDFCQGNFVTLTSILSSSYLWNNGATSQAINVNSSGNYFCSITSQNGCQATTNTIEVTSSPDLFSVTGGGSYCSGENGVAIGLSSSQSGVNYQLKNGIANVGSPVPGNGLSLNFGLQTAAGTYTVTGTHTSSGCTSAMTGSAVVTIDPLPTAFNITGGGSYCQGGNGKAIGLSNSQLNVSYELFLDGNSTGNIKNGTGTSFSFGNFTAAGNYSVIATNTLTGCTVPMNNTINISINTLPALHTVTGGGDYCINGTGVDVGLDFSDINHLYQLKLNNVNTGSALPGNNNMLSFGNQTEAGDYTVIATDNSTGCTASMNGFATVDILPVPQIANITGGGTYCAIPGDGIPVGLSNSENDVSYQLFLNSGNAAGPPVSGNGLPFSFGNQTAEGIYSVIATNTLTSCSTSMNGNVTVTRNEATDWYHDSDGDGYGDAADVVSGCSQPAGYIFDNTDCNDMNSGIHPGAIELCGNGIDENCNNLIDENCSSVNLHLKIFIEGFYIGNGTMNAVADPAGHPTICDTIVVELHEAVTPYAIAASLSDTIDVNGNGLFVFPGLMLPENYYIVVRHRNCIETWSKFPVLFDNPEISFDFTAP